MVNERGRVLAIHGSGTFSCADKGVEAQLSSTSGARLAKGTLWFGNDAGPLGRLETLLPARLPTGACRTPSVEQPKQEVGRSHRHRRSARFRILLDAAQAQFESGLAVSVESERWYTRVVHVQPAGRREDPIFAAFLTFF
jgi:hypothetical protein